MITRMDLELNKAQMAIRNGSAFLDKKNISKYTTMTTDKKL